VSLETTIDDPEWPEILRACQDQLATKIHTSLPGIVKSYDVTTQTAVVQLAVQLQGATVPSLADVPVVWPGGAQGFFHAPLAANDTVLVVFTEEDFGPWLASGSVSAPAVLARHGLHAVAIPGLRRTPLAVTGGHATIGVTSELRLGSDSASDLVALEPGVATQLNNLINALKTVIAAAVDPTGIPTAAKTAFATAATAVQTAISGGAMAATKVKAL
jgi:hypothetical protein